MESGRALHGTTVYSMLLILRTLPTPGTVSVNFSNDLYIPYYVSMILSLYL